MFWLFFVIPIFSFLKYSLGIGYLSVFWVALRLLLVRSGGSLYTADRPWWFDNRCEICCAVPIAKMVCAVASVFSFSLSLGKLRRSSLAVFCVRVCHCDSLSGALVLRLWRLVLHMHACGGLVGLSVRSSPFSLFCSFFFSLSLSLASASDQNHLAQIVIGMMSPETYHNWGGHARWILAESELGTLGYML